MSFDEWFKRATGNCPFPFQRPFAEEGEIPELVDVLTGLGKTTMAAGKRKGSSNGSRR